MLEHLLNRRGDDLNVCTLNHKFLLELRCSAPLYLFLGEN
jgi:hypothetical protein